MSRKRLCAKADIKTRELWNLVKKVMYDVDMAMASAMQPECVYRGKCTEMKPCNEA